MNFEKLSEARLLKIAALRKQITDGLYDTPALLGRAVFLAVPDILRGRTGMFHVEQTSLPSPES